MMDLKDTAKQIREILRLRDLKSINWSRSNGKLWEGRALIGGRVSKSSP
jgi:DNA sulfur modification protein DndB